MEDQFEKLTEGAGFCHLAGRTLVELTGSDRAKFLHGLCTNDINSLQPGTGCEAFLTNVQGKTAGYVYVTCSSDLLVLDTVAGQAAAIVEGMDKYLIREDVEIRDRTEEWAELLLAGRLTEERLPQFDWNLVRQPLSHIQLDYGPGLTLSRVPFGGKNSYFVRGPAADIAEWAGMLIDAGIEECQSAMLERLRIEAGSPLYGIDVTTDNLPQEVGRDEEAIHFNKGCYLGQETIARLDALGHVNRLLVCLRFQGDRVPAAGIILEHDNKPLARITSACWSSTLEAPIALAYVRRSHMAVGSRFESDFGTAEVIVPPQQA